VKQAATSRNNAGYQEFSWGGVKDDRRVRLTTSQASVSRLSKRKNVGASMSHNPTDLHGLLHV
jgi:hypothetical protein